MKVLIVGGGGREHALAWKVAQSPQVQHVWVAPGNAGTAKENKVENVAIASDQIDTLLEFAHTNHIALTIVGPEIPLSLGIVDRFTQEGLRCFGPSQAAAQLESSKSFCKAFLSEHQIPTARYADFSDAQAALAYIQHHPYPLVIKADGLAAGKGVIIAENAAQAEKAIHDMLSHGQFKAAGKKIVIEAFLEGEELSYIILTDGHHVIPFASSQDHKRRDDGDKGPNTGGMGAYSPAPCLTPALEQTILDTIIHPTLSALHQNNATYVGFLYAGLMITPEGTPKVLEFNCRLGDPETQPLLYRLKSDLVGLCMAATEGMLASVHAEWDPRPALSVVLASGGYPDAYTTGHRITGLDAIADQPVKVFHAGTALKDDAVVTTGGRVLAVTALGDTVRAAQQAAYAAIQKIHWDGMFYRHDIGHRGVTPGCQTRHLK